MMSGTSSVPPSHNVKFSQSVVNGNQWRQLVRVHSVRRVGADRWRSSESATYHIDEVLEGDGRGGARLGALLQLFDLVGADGGAELGRFQRRAKVLPRYLAEALRIELPTPSSIIFNPPMKQLRKKSIQPLRSRWIESTISISDRAHTLFLQVSFVCDSRVREYVFVFLNNLN